MEGSEMSYTDIKLAMFEKGYVDDTNREPPYIVWRYSDDIGKTINPVKKKPKGILKVVEDKKS